MASVALLAVFLLSGSFPARAQDTRTDQAGSVLREYVDKGYCTYTYVVPPGSRTEGCTPPGLERQLTETKEETGRLKNEMDRLSSLVETLLSRVDSLFSELSEEKVRGAQLEQNLTQELQEQETRLQTQCTCERLVPGDVISTTTAFLTRTATTQPSTPILTEWYLDCDAVKLSGEQSSGVFWILPRDTVEPFPVYCDLQDGEGAWTVVQQRDHTVGENFTRGWEDYKNGFGVIPRDYWLGNEKIHQLTKEGDFRVKIQVQSFGGLQRPYEYDNFKVAGEEENYRLTLTNYTGIADSCMGRAGEDLNGMAFSTMDRDNDRAGYSCAERWKGGWWYKSCSLLILNGVIKEYNGHEEYREVTGRGEGLYNVCLQQWPPVSLSTVTIKIQARERADVYRDCDHARSEGKTTSGVYQIQPQGATAPFSAFCEMDPSGTGWTVIQRRTQEGTVNFTRGWEDYKKGFGDLEGELWLGLENIYTLTNQGQYALQIDFRGYTGVSGYTLYSSFKIENETDSYRLRLGHRLRGTSDCLNTRSTGKNVTGMAFSTFDRDHDLASYNCAEEYRGGWWFNRCSSVIINGVKKYWRTHDQYYEEVGQGLGLYNVCLQQGPPVSLSDVAMKISALPN